MNRTGTRAVVALISAGLLASPALTGQAAAQTGLVLENVANPRYVLDNDAGRGEGSSVLVYGHNGGPNQVWEVSPEGGNTVQIKQEIGGRDLCAAAVFNGIAEVSMQNCDNSGRVTWWTQVELGSNRWAYRNNAQGRCLAATRLNGPVELVECAFGDQEQQWIKRAG
ncbi:ricin-type beta-trefoil lectin domain protein [Streptomyces sp. SudanB182_2057]|uniref:ricin-type beta-trefoil lectin domain protein n=1 Tax=Streptomyces sp. SudanB182_2057 TaxID=3035281 RepID=UPI003F566AB2